MTSTLEKIEKLTGQYANAHDLLTERVQELQADIMAAKRKRLHWIKVALRKVKTAEAELDAAIKASPELFKKPRTLVIEGIRVGLTKGKGKLVISNEEKSIARVRKHMSDQEDILIKTKESLIKAALNNLTVTQLRLLGITVKDTGDQVVIKPTDSDVDKLIDALLEEKELQDEKGQAA